MLLGLSQQLSSFGFKGISSAILNLQQEARKEHLRVQEGLSGSSQEDLQAKAYEKECEALSQSLEIDSAALAVIVEAL